MPFKSMETLVDCRLTKRADSSTSISSIIPSSSKEITFEIIQQNFFLKVMESKSVKVNPKKKKSGSKPNNTQNSKQKPKKKKWRHFDQSGKNQNNKDEKKENSGGGESAQQNNKKRKIEQSDSERPLKKSKFNPKQQFNKNKVNNDSNKGNKSFNKKNRNPKDRKEKTIDDACKSRNVIEFNQLISTVK
jgi:hypothetical protein